MDANPPSVRKEELLRARMASLGISEDELVESFVRGFGPGGQKVNKTSSCVRLSLPRLGIEVKCQQSRSLALNRYRAREEICEKVAEAVAGEKSRRRAEEEKIRRQKRRRSRRAKAKMLADKRANSEKKALRKAPSPE
ncbi:MAG: peptide chain release factor-like protein [Kiritimatiellae bacterium]|nr:peptide chain release factor-like protein [Kiritimatiellia bacterium]